MKKATAFIMAFVLAITMFSAQSKVEASTGHHTVTVDTNLNVREKPSSKAKVVGSLKNGTVVYVYNTEPGGWSKIKYNNKAGYVASIYLKAKETNSTKISNNQLITNLNALKIQHKGEIITLTGWSVEEEDGLGANLQSIPVATLKKLDRLHARGGDKAVREWAGKVIKEVDKAAASRGLSRGFIDVTAYCQSYKPKNFPEKDVLDYTGSCGYSFPIMFAEKGSKTPSIFYEY